MSRAECLSRAARAFAVGRDLMTAVSPREAAEAAYYAGGPSVDDLEARIVARRADTARAA